MNTLADFKRELTIGRRIRVTYLSNGVVTPINPKRSPDTIREVTVVQTAKFATRFEEVEKCYMQFGKAGSWTFDGNVATYTDPEMPSFQIRYTLDPEGDA